MGRGKPFFWIVAILVLLITAGAWVMKGRAASDRSRIIVLAVDGMDWGYSKRLMEQGKLPNLSRLTQSGSFLQLESSMPPLSPVAWSNFITGMNPGGHGVFDFLRRDPALAGRDLLPEDAVAKVSAPTGRDWNIPFTSYVWPATGKAELLRKGPVLWQILQDHGIPSTVYKAPANFPVSAGDARVISGMGTPDIEGTYGTFTYLSDRPADREKEFNGGRFLDVKVEGGIVKLRQGDGRPLLHGPVNPFNRAGQEQDNQVDVPFEAYVDPQQQSAVVVIQNQQILLKQGEWSEWQKVGFELLPGVVSVDGYVRFHLQEASPDFRLFVSPVNLAPGTEGLASGGFDSQLADALGPYFTKGMPEETKAITGGLFTSDEYLKQSELVMNESVDALNFILNNTDRGFQFIYFSTLDLNCHVLWHLQDPNHPLYNPQQPPALAQSMTDIYMRIDAVVGQVMDRLGPQDVLYVMSDHGFGPAYREFNLNRWLADEGYLVYRQVRGAQPRTRDLSDIDWGRTRAYGLGFQSLYINKAGRESSGIVRERNYATLVEEIRTKLLALRDKEGAGGLRDVPVFHSVYRPADIYSGDQQSAAPDLILGYNRGFCPSDDAVLGSSGTAALANHVTGFSGHHTTDFSLVPGVLFSSKRLTAEKAKLEDITATILADHGLQPADGMTGKPIK